MAQSTIVKNHQLKELGKGLRANGVSQKNLDDFLKDNDKLTEFCTKLKGDSDGWFEKLQVAANTIGGRVHLIPKLTVDYARPHNDAAKAGGPQTESDSYVLKVANDYKSSETKAVDETIVLLRLTGYFHYMVGHWGLKNGLRLTTPHIPFAIGEQMPQLNREIGLDKMYVIETTGCLSQGHSLACFVNWHNTELKADLASQNILGGLPNPWYAFRK